MNVWERSAHELQTMLRRRELSSSELTRSVLARLRQVEPRIRAYISLMEEDALEQAARADRRLRQEEGLTPFTGIPLAIKDNMMVRGQRTTCASRMLENYVAIYDATVIQRLRQAGAVLLGKTNMDEFAMGSSNEHSAFFPTRNPWDLERVPGGSSGGSAAAVAAGAAVAALGSDTGGSIRQPAALCGICGLKPTYGRVSRYGLVAFASSLEQIGPLTRDVRDAAHLLNLIAGGDPRDSTSAPEPRLDWADSLHPRLEGLRVGVPREYLAQGMEEEVGLRIWEGVRVLEKLGARVEETSLPFSVYGLPTYYLIAPAEASSNLARFDGVRYGYRAVEGDVLSMYQKSRRGFGPEVRRRIMLGTYALSAGYYDAYYLQAQKVRTLIRRDFAEAFTRYDALVTPTSPTVAFPLGARLDDPLAMYLSDVCTLPINMAGIPAISVPCGFASGLPVGMQILGAPFAESRILQVAYGFQCATDYHLRRPSLEDSPEEKEE